jgi:uncharacterized cupredoxin-like copper-binding protein
MLGRYSGVMNPSRIRQFSILGALALALTACGSDGSGQSASTAGPAGSAAASRVVDITMSDIAYDIPSLEVEVGETVEFRFTNTGKLPHDAFIGDADAQSEHEEEMAGMPGMHHGEDGEPAITVDAGLSGTLTYTFGEAGELQIGCHQSGHFAKGMHVAVTVA